MIINNAMISALVVFEDSDQTKTQVQRKLELGNGWCV